MKNKALSVLFTVLGFAFSLIPPIWAANTQIAFLRQKESLLEIVGITAGGAVVIGAVVIIVFWKYFSDFFKSRLRSNRTAFGFFLIGYLVIVSIGRLIETLELIFLFGMLGAAVSIVLFRISDYFKRKGRK